jgi:hypothetical protein
MLYGVVRFVKVQLNLYCEVRDGKAERDILFCVEVWERAV